MPPPARLGLPGSTTPLPIPIVPGMIGIAFGIAWQLGIPLVGAWAAMLTSRSFDRRRLPRAARMVRAAATAVLLAVVTLAAADLLDGVATIL